MDSWPFDLDPQVMEGSASSPATSGGGPVGAANTGKPGATGEEVLDKKRLQVCLLKSRLLHSHWVIQADRKSRKQGGPDGHFHFFWKKENKCVFYR